MSFVSKIVGSITGANDAAKASQNAANVQAQSASDSIGFQREALDKELALTKPYTDLGAANTSRLQDLITNPQAQIDYINNNPFFKALTDKATNTTLSNAAAKGRVGTGGTAEALQNSLLLIGNDLLQQQIGNVGNLVTTGANAATGQGTQIQNTADNVSNLTLASGQAQANGLVNAANTRTAATQNLINTGLTAYALCDIRAKNVHKRVGETSQGIPLYLFNYKGDVELHVNVIAQEVEEFMPDAVHEINGYKYVDMEQIYGS